MSSLYPGGLDSFPTDRTNDTVMEDNHPGDHNNYADAINNIEATLGLAPQGVFGSVRDRLDNGFLRGDPVTISSAQILAFDGTEGTNVEILPAPGSSKAIIVLSAPAVYRTGGTPYADGSDLFLGPYGASFGLAEIWVRAATLRETFTGGDGMALTFQQGSDSALAAIENAPIVVNIQGAQWTTGNGHIVVTPVYFVLSL